MKMSMMRGVLAAAVVCAMAAVATAQTTRTISGTVVEVNGGTLVVKMSSGDIRMFTPPADRKFLVDGKELTLSELQPGTNLKATITESPTTVVDRTVETLQGTVIFASGPSVILRLASGETKLYTIKADDPVKFRDGSGKEITVFDLRKDMKINATKITEAPRTELVATAVVTGTNPRAAGAGAGAGAGAAQVQAQAPVPPSRRGRERRPQPPRPRRR